MKWFAALVLAGLTATTFCAPEVAPEVAPEKSDKPLFVSPDGKFDMRVTKEGHAIVRIADGKTMTVLPGKGTVVWSTDSQRFGFNYKSSLRYFPANLYQLRREKFAELASPEDVESDLLEAQIDAQLKKNRMPKNANMRRISDRWKILRWLDAETAELYVERTAIASHEADGETAAVDGEVIITIKFDKAGKWKAVKSRRPTKKEVAEIQAD